MTIEADAAAIRLVAREVIAGRASIGAASQVFYHLHLERRFPGVPLRGIDLYEGEYAGSAEPAGAFPNHSTAGSSSTRS